MKFAPLVFVVAGAGILAALFYGLKPTEQDAPPPAPALAVVAPAAQPLPIAPQPETELLVDYRVAGGKRVEGPELIQLRQGDKLRIKVLSDADDELHMHGYEQHAHLHAGKATELALTADHSGRFEIELHKSHLQLAVLEVQPR